MQSDFASTPIQGGARPSLKTSLITDPPNGRLPPLTPEAQRRVGERRPAQNDTASAETWHDDRGANWCVFHENGGPILPDGIGYGSNYLIVQSHDWVTIVYEWNSERRAIPLDGRPHGSVRSYAGDSRGWWEGDTLVVETVNFKNPPNGRRFRASDGSLKLVERFTRTAADTVDYRFTVTSPARDEALQRGISDVSHCVAI